MTQSTNLTEGSIARQLVSLACPLILGNILQQFYNTVDALVIGRFVGQTAFAAIGVAGTLMNLFIFLLCGCCAGISIIFAQFYGKGDLAGFRREGFLAASFGGLFTVLLSILALLLLKPLLSVMQTPADVALYSAQYLSVIFCGLLATYLYNLCSAALRAVGNTRIALAVLMTAMVANLGLDLLFVAALRMGIAGAAWATVLSQLLSAALCILYLLLRFPQLLFKREDMLLDLPLLQKTANYGAVSALHQSSLYIGKLLIQGAVNSMGTEMISAYTATSRIEGFANSFGDSGAEAVSVFTAQNTGKGDRQRIRSGLRTGMALMCALGILMSLILYTTATPCVQFLIGATEGAQVTNGIAYLKLVSFFYLLCFVGNTFVGFYRGSGRVKMPVYGTILSISIRTLFSYLFISRMGLGAVALATGLGWGAVVLFQSAVYWRRCRK